jgi:AcrR family transcriptional regulator
VSNTSEERDEARRRAILDAAYEVFGAYGFKRVTMDDIAKAAGLSRPALYLVFKNKTDIFQAGVQQVAADSFTRAQVAAGLPGSLEERILAVIDAAFLEVHRQITVLPHGPELVGMKSEVGEELIRTWYAQIENVIAGLIDAEVKAGKAVLQPARVTSAECARLLIAGVDGVKSRASDLADIEAMVAKLVHVVCLSLRAEQSEAAAG